MGSSIFCRGLAAGGIAMLAACPAFAAATDLSGWTAEGSSGNWVLSADNNSVTQTNNGEPTVFYSDFNAFGRSLSGTLRVNTSSDDDFIGFVVGYDPGELATAGEFYLIDWKQTTQNSGGIAYEGLALSRVTAAVNGNLGVWPHDPARGVTELARGATLGSTGWEDFTTYSFDIEYSATNLTVYVDGVLQFDIDGSFSDGRFGFWNFSQSAVVYGSVEDDVLPPAVPEPASWAMMIGGFGLVGGAMRRRGTRRALAPSVSQ